MTESKEKHAKRVVDGTRKDSAEQFRRDYECLRRLFDHAGDAIFVHGLDGQFTDVNLAACKTLGYTREELLRMCPWDFVVHDSREKILSVWVQMQPGLPITVDDELRRKDGTSFPVEVRLVRYSADHREVIIAICRDITKRRQAEAAMLKADLALVEERNRMAREIHDTLAQSFTGILLQLEAAEAATEAGLSANGYISRVRDIARFGLGEARRSVLALRPLVLEEQGLEHALRQLAERSSVEGAIICELTASGTVQRLDPAVELGIFRVAQEAVGNSVKHAKATRISIELMFASEGVTLSVTDNGNGRAVHPDVLAKKGYGLLAMRERAQAIGGNFKIQDVTGGGTRISLVVSTVINLANT
jgi:PAS domain S-box-containing protein